MYDFIIIGGGPAGISAAVYAVSRGLRVFGFRTGKNRRSDWESVHCKPLYSHCRG